MKKIFALLITAALLSITAAAERFETSITVTDATTFAADTSANDLTSSPAENEPAPYKTIYDLYQAWHTDTTEGCPYPDYICGVWTDTGNIDVLTVATTKDEAGLAGQKEILSLIENDESVKFTFASYPAHELWAVQETIIAEMGGDSPIISCGIDEMNNCVSVGVLHSASDADTTAKRLLEENLDKVVVEFTNGFVLDCNTAGIIDPAIGNDTGILTTGAETGSEYNAIVIMSKPNYTFIWITAAALCVAIIAISAVLIARSRRVLQTANGIINEKSTLSKKQITDAIKEAPPTPDDRILEMITEKLNKLN